MRALFAMALALVAGSVACATETVEAPTTDATPAVAELDGALHVFVRSATDGRVLVASNAEDRTWRSFHPIAGLTTDVGPAAALFGGKLRAFARSAADGGVHQALASADLEWSSWSRIPDITTELAPAAVVFDGRLHVFAVDAGNHTIQWSTSVDGNTWSESSTRGDSTSSTPAVGVLDGALAYFWVDDVDGAVHLATSPDADNWTEGAPLATNAPVSGVSVGTFGQDLYVTVLDASTGHVLANMTRAPIAAPRWGGWFEIPSISTDVAVATVGVADGVRWFARGIDDGAVHEARTPVYKLPFDDGAGWRVATGNFDDPIAGHGPGDYSFDLAHAEDGTAVRAMRDGHVVLWEADETCSFFEDWACADPEHCCSVVSKMCLSGGEPHLGNVVLIQHDDGTVASYNHLTPGSIPDAVRSCGALVRSGDVVGQVGHTGAVCGPSHVHVGVVSRWTNTNGSCIWGGAGYPDRSGIDFQVPMLPIYFEDAQHAAWRPIVGDVLTPSSP